MVKNKEWFEFSYIIDSSKAMTDSEGNIHIEQLGHSIVVSEADLQTVKTILDSKEKYTIKESVIGSQLSDNLLEDSLDYIDSSIKGKYIIIGTKPETETILINSLSIGDKIEKTVELSSDDLEEIFSQLQIG